MSTTKNTTTTEITKHLDDVKGSINLLETELESLRAEQTELQAAIANGSLTVDLDRLGDLTDALIPRRQERLDALVRQTLPEAEKAVHREELYRLAEVGADGITGHWEAHQTVVESAERRIAKALAEVRASTEEWSTFIAGVGQAAKTAQLSQNNLAAGDHPVRYHASYGQRASDPIIVLFEGETYRPVSADAAVREVVASADAHTASLIREANDERVAGEGARIQSLDRRA